MGYGKEDIQKSQDAGSKVRTVYTEKRMKTGRDGKMTQWIKALAPKLNNTWKKERIFDEI